MNPTLMQVPPTTSTFNDSYTYARFLQPHQPSMNPTLMQGSSNHTNPQWFLHLCKVSHWPLTYLTGKTWGKASGQSSILLVISRTTLSTWPCLNLSTFVKTTCKQGTVVAQLDMSLVTQQVDWTQWRRLHATRTWWMILVDEPCAGVWSMQLEWTTAKMGF